MKPIFGFTALFLINQILRNSYVVFIITMLFSRNTFKVIMNSCLSTCCALISRDLKTAFISNAFWFSSSVKSSFIGHMASLHLPTFDEMCSLVELSVLVEQNRFLENGSRKLNSKTDVRLSRFQILRGS